MSDETDEARGFLALALALSPVPAGSDARVRLMAALDRERAVLREQASGSGKSDEIVNRMVEGRLRKFYEDTVLLEQVFVVDGETRVSKVVEAVAKEAGKAIKVTGFVRMQLGEGIDKPTTDLAAEVAATLKG